MLDDIISKICKVFRHFLRVLRRYDWLRLVKTGLGPVLVSVFPKKAKRPDWTGLSNTVDGTEEFQVIRKKAKYIHTVQNHKYVERIVCSA
jgi:hypothetical protein